MLSKISEKSMHSVRWVLVIGWSLLIFSLFYDPISASLTDPNNTLSPLRDYLPLWVNDPTQCASIQGECLPLEPYAAGARIFWGMIVPAGIMIVLVFGHETWRRICPLYFFSQIPRALNITPLLKIENNQWLVRNHFYLQFGLFFIGLNSRILFINSARPVLGLFLILTILSAILMVALYGGRSWCHYICPFGMVQTVFTGPRGLLGSEAHTAPPMSITQSMCRTIDTTTQQEQSACIGCKSPCMDIDSEKAYWEQLAKPGRRLVQYGYLGLVIGYFVYYRLYSGNFFYYFSGAWTHEPNQLGNLLKPGFYLMDTPIAIPKLVASPLTLAVFVAVSVLICTRLEKGYQAFLKKNRPWAGSEQALHQFFSIITFLSFNIFFIYGGRPEINRLPLAVQFLFQSIVTLVSALWLFKTWGRSPQQYARESLVDKLRRQLRKLPLDLSRFLEGRSIEQLKPDEVYILAKTLPGATQQNRMQIYKGVLQEAIQAGHIDSANNLHLLQQMRQQLDIKDKDYYQLLSELARDRETLPLFYPSQPEKPWHVAPTRVGKSRITSDRTQARIKGD